MRYTELQASEARQYILDICDKYEIPNIRELIETDMFFICSGSSSSVQHHYGKHGLIIHTAEVLRLCLSIVETLNIKLDKKIIVLAAIFHDTGKMWDYIPIDQEKNEWESTNHKYMIHHISKSAIVFDRYSGFNSYLTEDEKSEITHAILAHHGLREWGSPVTPQTQLAWLLHLCDSLSARLDDSKKKD